MIATLETNVVALASAGTGKTHGLVGAMLRALLGVSRLGGREPHPPLAPARLVAATFSRRAAGEMHARLSSELERLQTAPSTSLHLAHLREAALDVRVDLDDKTLARRARAAHAMLPRARISTLHSLAHDLVRSNATLAGLPPDFGVANEEEELRILEGAIERTLQHFERTEPSLLAALATITGTGEALADRLTALLAERDEDGSRTLAVPNDDARIVEEQMNRKPSDPFDLGDIAKDPLLPRVPGGRNNTKKARAEAFNLAHAMRHQLGDIAAGAARLLEHAAEEARREHARHGKLGFGGVLRAARDLLAQHPDVALEISRTMDALFVDELQDTSRVQCDIVRMLWQREGAWRASGLYVVGDRKQSIYAFRGADVSVFSRFCVELAGEPARTALGLPANVPVPIRPSAKLVVLRENHRSRPALLAFTNAAAPHILVPESDESFEARYVEETERLVAPAGSPAPAGPAVTWLRWKDGPRKKMVVADEARVVATRIAEIGLARAWREIAVLARTNEMLDAVAHELARLEIPHVVGGHGFFRAREIRDMLAFLAVLVRPLDRKALLEVARGIWLGATDRSLLALVDPGRGLAPVEDWRSLVSASNAIDPVDRDDIVELAEVVMRLRQTVDRIGPAGALREAMAALDVEAVLARLPRGPQRLANVRKLVGMAEKEPSALAFLDRSLEIAEGAREPEAATFSDEDDAVRLLTAHASKGLDFPVVILPQIGAGGAVNRLPPIALERTDDETRVVARVPRPGGRTIEPPSFRRAVHSKTAREEADRRRLAYVAITRASQEMILVGDKADPKPGSINRAVLDVLGGSEAWTIRVELVDETQAIGPRPAPPQSVRSFAAPPTKKLTARSLPIATTALADFHHCPRRFQLAHVIELPEAPAQVEREGDASTDPRREGIAIHRILEHVDFEKPALDAMLDREAIEGEARARVKTRIEKFLASNYAKRIVKENAAIERERTFVLALDGLILKGSIDLVVAWPDGKLDVIDYKRARGPNVEPHAFQLDAYAFAIAKANVRAGIVFLGGTPEPRFRTPQDPDATERSLVALAKKLQAARAAEHFPRIEKSGCRAIRCGYERLCHPPSVARPGGSASQLELF